MREKSVFTRVRRAYLFARHIPLGKLTRRIELNLQRALRDWVTHVNKSPSSVRRAAAPPLPLFAPRTRLAPSFAGGLCFTFLNRSVAMHGSGVDWTAPGPGVENQLWRMNLHYMEYLEAIDDSTLVSIVSDWIESNPIQRRGAWRDSWNSYTLSLRAVVWMQEMARRGAALSKKFVEAVELSLITQMIFLEHNIETDIGGNHLIKNIKALVWASVYFEGPEAERWRAKALQYLKKELIVQILPDGMHYERSLSYHAQVFADLLECRHALRGDPLGGALDEALARMAQVTVDLVHPDGYCALFNDAGLNMSYTPDECMEVFTRIFGMRPRVRSVFGLPHAGYFGLRENGDCLFVDCGCIAPNDLPAHGHGDILSFEWSVAGKRIIVDPGVFEYVAGERRQISRSAASHNTVCLEGSDQAEFFGAFRCGRRPNVELRRWEPSVDGFVLEGSHDGFVHLQGHPRHVRRFDVRANEILIRDKIEGSTDRRVQISMLLHPEVKVQRTKEGFELQREGTLISLTSTYAFSAIKSVWWPAMGHELATLRLVGYMPQGECDGSMSLNVISRGDPVG